MGKNKKIFGIGLNKTGTTTLGKCFRHFGFCHRGFDRPLLERCCLNDYTLLFETISQYDSFVDWPYPLCYEKIYEKYPEAFFILTTRISDGVWLESLKKHSLFTDPENHCRKLAYSYDYPQQDEEYHLKFYTTHNENVRKFFNERPHSKFIELCWEKGDGWETLCRFLNQPVPVIPFPHANKMVTKPVTSTQEQHYEGNLAKLEMLRVGNTVKW